MDQYKIQDSDAEDIVQDILAAVVRDLSKFEHNQRTGAFRNWLRTMLIHRVRNFWRSWKYRPLVTGTSSLGEHLNQLQDDASEVSRLWNREHDDYVMKGLMEAARPRFEPKTCQAFQRQLSMANVPMLWPGNWRCPSAAYTWLSLVTSAFYVENRSI